MAATLDQRKAEFEAAGSSGTHGPGYKRLANEARVMPPVAHSTAFSGDPLRIGNAKVRVLQFHSFARSKA